jgi:hypothetical protein
MSAKHVLEVKRPWETGLDAYSSRIELITLQRVIELLDREDTDE